MNNPTALLRVTQHDTHWNTSNMIYGDNPQKINEREDKLGLKTYSYAPQIIAVVQSGNLYVYAVGNPVMYADEDGEMAKLVKAAIHGLLSGVISSINTETDDFGDYAINFALGFAQGFISDYFDLGVILVGLLSSVASAISLYFESDNTDTFVESLCNIAILSCQFMHCLNQFTVLSAGITYLTAASHVSTNKR